MYDVIALIKVTPTKVYDPKIATCKNVDVI